MTFASSFFFYRVPGMEKSLKKQANKKKVIEITSFEHRKDCSCCTEVSSSLSSSVWTRKMIFFKAKLNSLHDVLQKEEGKEKMCKCTVNGKH